MSEVKIPNQIYLQWYGDGSPKDGGPKDANDASWCTDKIFEHDIKYVLSDNSEKLAEALNNILVVWENKDKVPGWARRFIKARNEAKQALEEYRGVIT